MDKFKPAKKISSLFPLFENLDGPSGIKAFKTVE